MADSVTIFQTFSETEKLLARLKNNDQDVGFTFNPQDREHSLIYTQGFKDFVDQLRKTLEGFRQSPSTNHLVTVELDLLNIPKEGDVSKKTFREFFNELLLKFIDDHLDNSYPYLNKITLFPEIENSELTDQDFAALSDWEEKIIKDFEKFIRINGATAGKEKEADRTEEKVEKTPSGGFRININLGDGNFRQVPVQPGQTYEHADGSVATFTEEMAKTATQVDPYVGYQLFSEAVERESIILEQQFLISYGLKAVTDSLPPELEAMIRMEVSEELKRHFSDYFENGRIGVGGHSKAIRAVLSRLQHNPSFQAYLLDFVDYAVTLAKDEPTKTALKAKLQEVKVEEIVKDASDEEKLKQTEGERATKLLKNQMARILAASSQDYNPALLDNFLQIVENESVHISSLSEMDERTFLEIFPPTQFSINERQRQDIIFQINQRLKERRRNPAENAGAMEDAAKMLAQSPTLALTEALNAGQFDGQINSLINRLDAYSLTNKYESVDLHTLVAHLRTTHPDVSNNAQLMEFVQRYVEDRKKFFAEYTHSTQLYRKADADDNDTLILANAIRLETYINIHGSPVVAQALYNDRLFEKIEELSEDERQIRLEAHRLKLELYLQSMDAEEKAVFIRQQDEETQQALLAFDAQYRQMQSEGEKVSALNEFAAQQQNLSAVISSQGIDYPPQPDSETFHSPQIAQDASSKFKLFRNANKALRFLKPQSMLRKAAMPIAAGAAGAGLGFGVAMALFGTAKAVLIGSGVGGTVGAVAGFAVGGPLGAAIGGFLGSVIGGGAGYLINGGTINIGGHGSQAAAMAKEFSSHMASSGAKLGTTAADAATQTFTASGANISTTTSIVAVGAPIITLTVVSTLSLMTIMGAFLPDASTTQVAPYYSLDIEESRYVTLTKKAQPSSASTPGSITYAIDLSKKPKIPEDIIITSLTDTPSVIDKELNPVEPPQIPEEAIQKLKAFEGQPLTEDNPIHVEFTVDASDPRFKDTLVKNDIKVVFTANGVTSDSASRAQTCFGDCPVAQVPACWPIDGQVSQLPGRAGPASNPIDLECMPRGGGTHCGTNLCIRGWGAKCPPDAYDLGTANDKGRGAGVAGEVPIYAAAPGTVIHSSTAQEENFGYYVLIDHGTFRTFYLHMAYQSPVKQGDFVQGGQQIGLVGGTGGSHSWAVHLHYEIAGLNDWVLYNTLHGQFVGGVGQFTSQVGIVCNDYYGNNN